MTPLIEELIPAPDPADALAALADLPGVLLLESSLQREPVGAFSFLTADPFDGIEVPQVRYGDDPLLRLRERLQPFVVDRIPDLPPFQGGAAGLIGYEAGRVWEKFPRAARDDFEMPDVAIGLYDWVIAWDHRQRRAWIISQGFPEQEPSKRQSRAASRIQFIKERLAGGTNPARHTRDGNVLAPDQLAPKFPAPGLPGLVSNFDRAGYLQAVRRVIEYIYAGDIFQANLSQRLLYPLRETPLDLYLRLRRRNPAPFAGYFAGSDWTIASASPERFVSARAGSVETRPIKGTRRRQHHPEADLYTRDELRESAKDQAENVMIVDLLRNDLSRVCRAGSIAVPRLCAVETYETVQHLVSEIRGELSPGRDAWDLLKATFPGGSITGAPKIRAMEVIAELEPTVRGPYCGSLFYIGFDGAMDSNILIRTFTCRRGWIQCPVGGGIVAQSDPAAEYEETLHKAAGMLRALVP